MEFPAFLTVILGAVVCLAVVLAVYLCVYKRRINRALATGERGARMPAPYQVAAVLTVVLLTAGIVVSYFAGYKTACDRMETGAAVLSPEDLSTFYAEVEEVAPNAITVTGIALNEAAYRGTIRYEVWGETQVMSGTEAMALSDLERGDLVAITLVTGAGGITDVFKIQLLS